MPPPSGRPVALISKPKTRSPLRKVPICHHHSDGAPAWPYWSSGSWMHGVEATATLLCLGRHASVTAFRPPTSNGRLDQLSDAGSRGLFRAGSTCAALALATLGSGASPAARLRRSLRQDSKDPASSIRRATCRKIRLLPLTPVS